MDVISLLLFLALLILAFTRKTNMGAALILGRIVGLTDKEVVKTLSSSLFVTLTGITLLFAAVNHTGALELVSNKLVSLIGKRIWLLPIVSGATSYLMSWLQQKMNPMQQSNPQMQGSNKMMMLMMPLMSIWFGFMLPVGLTWYWICNNVLAAIQEVLMSIWTKKQLEKSQNK